MVERCWYAQQYRHGSGPPGASWIHLRIGYRWHGTDCGGCRVAISRRWPAPDPRVPSSLMQPSDVFAQPLERDFAGTRIAWSRTLARSDRFHHQRDSRRATATSWKSWVRRRRCRTRHCKTRVRYSTFCEPRSSLTSTRPTSEIIAT